MKNLTFVRSIFSGLTLVMSMAVAGFAAEPLIWSVSSHADILKGDARGVSIASDGTITVAPRVTEVFKTGQSYIWSSAVGRDGSVFLGTGGEGKVFKVDAAGKGAVFADLAELNVSALAVGNAGELYAATMPDGKVYRIDAAGKAEVYFEPKEKYIWALAVLRDGLAVATGDGGRIYKVRNANATPEASLLFDTSETHIISLAASSNGELYAGTDPGGIVMRFGADGRPFGVLDSSLREIKDIAIGGDGSVYVLAIGESASAAKAADATAAAATEQKPVTVEKPNPLTPETPAKSRYDLTAAKSAVYRVRPDGGVDVVWSSGTVTGFSLAATATGVVLGTSDKGRVYDISNNAATKLLFQTDASQISTLRNTANGLIATSSNQGSLFRVANDAAAEGTYDSAILDARGTAQWGRIWWRSAGTVTIQTRSGNTERADETWSQWSTAMSDARGAQVSSPRARFMQWRAVLRGGASLSEVNAAFITRNIAPEVLSLTILPTNVGLLANPPIQIDPNIELSGMDPITFGIPSVAVPPRRVFQRGAVSLQWNAEDRNGDRLTYDVHYREVGDMQFKLLRGALTDKCFVIDGQSLADGRYVFKVTASDSLSNPVPLALTGERISEPVDIDNTPPVVTAVGTPTFANGRGRFVFDATDAASYLTRAEYSVNGGPWQTVYSDDGISDGPRERYTIEIPAVETGEYAVTLRVFDVNSNAGNARQVLRR